MKKAEEIMEILEAFDLVGSLRGATALAGCDPTPTILIRYERPVQGHEH